MDRVLAENLKAIRDDLQSDKDTLIIVDGQEGSGKSLFSLSASAFIDHDFNLDRVVFNGEQFKKAVMTASKGQVVLYDEAITGARAATWAKDISKSLVELLAQCRQKNLCIIMVIPSFFELQKYFAIHRSKALCHIYTDRLGRRGYFQVYNRNQKARLYVMGKKFYSYSESIAKWSFHGRFTNYYPINEQEYRAKKMKAFMEGSEPDKPAESRITMTLKKRLAVLLVELKERGWKNKELLPVFERNIDTRWSKEAFSKFLLENSKEYGFLTRSGRKFEEEGVLTLPHEKKSPNKPSMDDFKSSMKDLNKGVA